ncbi:MAG TPA: hypothetical protein VN306_03620, partial [Mycobacterium sp.]|nr:hypothetical protein [Mycobacterium sp.]
RVTSRWCEVGGVRQEQLWVELGWWYDRFQSGRLPASVRNARRKMWRANAYMGIALYQVINTPGQWERLRRNADWTRHLPTVPRVLAIGPIGLCQAPAALTDPLLWQSRPAPEEIVALAAWVQRAMRDGTRVVAEAQLVDLVASRMLDVLSERALGIVARTLTDAGAHHDELTAMSDRWLQFSIDRSLRYPDWLTAVVNASVAASAVGSFEYAERILVEAQPRARVWEPPSRMGRDFELGIERAEQLQQLSVGRAAWRRRKAQAMVRHRANPAELDAVVRDAIRLGHEATRAAIQIADSARQGQPTNATSGWILGALLRVVEPMAVACYADMHLGGDYRLSDEARGEFVKLRRVVADHFALAETFPVVGTDMTTRTRLATIRDLDEQIADGIGALEISVRQRIWTSTKSAQETARPREEHQPSTRTVDFGTDNGSTEVGDGRDGARSV